jgi:hypothetical protein
MTNRVGYMNCFTCKKQTTTSDLFIHEQEDKHGKCYYLKGTCDDCNKHKSRRLGKTLRSGITAESPSEKLLELLPSQPPVKQSSNIIKEGGTIPVDSVIAKTQDDIDGDGFWDSIKNIGRKKTFADRLGDTASKATKSLVRGIPIVGDLLADTGIVDKGIDLFSEYVWQPMKKWFGGSLDDAYIEQLKNNDIALSELAEKAMELRIKTGEGIVPKYLGELRNGSEEDKALAHVLMKTVCKSKFYKYLKEENIPSTMSILEAMTKYKNRQRPYKNNEEKALNILKELGYDNI